MSTNIKAENEQDKSVDTYNPQEEELNIQKYLEKRIEILKKTKTNVLDNINFEEIMKDADREYQPHFLGEKASNRVMLVQDEIKGLRGSRVVPITGKEGSEWRSDISEPTLLVKIQSALSILINQIPEAKFKAGTKRYESNTNIAKALWKRSWNLSGAKNQMKLFVFDLAKYGWAVGRTYPRLVAKDKEILIELDNENPENNKFEKKRIVEYNDIFREKLDPYRTWLDDMANLTDPFSIDDWYYEKDFSKDTFDNEFKNYNNVKYVKFGQKADENKKTDGRDDIVTVGFYESKNKDLYGIWIPNQSIVLYNSPLPNDDGKLSCWWSYWNIRDPRTIYGIGLFEILKHNKVLYDRFRNMTIDQLVMAIYPMLFYSGSNKLAGEGTMTISPGVMKQKLPGTTIDQVKINYDPRGWEAVAKIKESIDEDTGITPTIQGQITGKTLGEVLHAKDAALKRLNIPIENIAVTLEQEAYISLSWMNMIYSTPEVKKFTNPEDLAKYESDIGGRKGQNIKFNEDGSGEAEIYPQLELGMEEDREGNLVESPENRFFNVGEDIDTDDLKWEGKVTIVPQSILAPSKELERQRKLELFNLVMPSVQAMAQFMSQGMIKIALALYKPLKEILEIQDEKPENWLPKEIIDMAENPEIAQQVEKNVAKNDPKNKLFQTPEDQAAAEEQAKEQGQGGGQASAGGSIAPRGEVSNPLRKLLGSIGKTFKRDI